MKKPKDQLLDRAFAILMTVALLNLNGAISMATGVGQVASPALLIASVLLVWKLRQVQMPVAIKYLSISIIVYVFSALFVALSDGGNGLVRQITVANLSTVLMLWATSLYMVHVTQQGRRFVTLRLVRNISVIAAMTIVLSPLFYTVFQFVPASAESRWGGFFGNPNEAGFMGCVAFAFILAVPFRSKVRQTIFLVVAFSAAVLTFSKTAWLMLTVILLIYVVQSSIRNIFVLLALIATIPMVLMVDLTFFHEWLLNNSLFNLTGEQYRRIDHVITSINMSDKHEDLLTGRDSVWAFAIDKIMTRPIIGYGMGEFYHLVGGIKEGGSWLGVHNVYLLFWGEAGLLAFALIIATTIIAARNIIANASDSIACMLGTIVFLSLQVSHDVLTSRYSIVIVGIALCLHVRENSHKRVRVPTRRTEVSMVPKLGFEPKRQLDIPLFSKPMLKPISKADISSVPKMVLEKVSRVDLFLAPIEALKKVSHVDVFLAPIETLKKVSHVDVFLAPTAAPEKVSHVDVLLAPTATPEKVSHVDVLLAPTATPEKVSHVDVPLAPTGTLKNVKSADSVLNSQAMPETKEIVDIQL